jgi:hypothetical protein
MTVPPRQPDSFSQNQNRKELSPAGLPLPFSGSSFDENMLGGFHGWTVGFAQEGKAALPRAKRSSRDRFVETRRSLQVREPNTSRRRHTRAEDSQSSSSRAGRRPHHFRESQSVGVGRGFLAGMKSPTTQ